MRYHVQRAEHKCKKENWSLLGYISIFGSRRFLPIFLPFLTIIFSIFLPFLCVSPLLPLSPSGLPALPGNMSFLSLILIIVKSKLTFLGICSSQIFQCQLLSTLNFKILYDKYLLIHNSRSAPQVVESVISGDIGPDRGLPLPPDYLEDCWVLKVFVRVWSGP